MKKQSWLIWITLMVIGFNTRSQSQKIQIVNANTFEIVELNQGRVKKLIGQVQLKQDKTVLYCDSAYLFDEINFVEAYRNVRINHNDSVNFYGDMLKYDGKSKVAKLSKNVSMVDASTTLTTQELEFDLNANKASYYSGATITSYNNKLSSQNGYYYSNTHELFFKNKVVLNNPEFNMVGDTLKYNTTTKVATFLGKTLITADTDSIFCKAGNYNTEKQSGVFRQRAKVKSAETTIIADTIIFNRKTKYAKAIGKIVLTDTVNNIIAQGNMAEFFGLTGKSYLTQKPLVTTTIDKDSTHIWADSICIFKKNQWQASNQVRAYNKVKIYKSNLQASCDSLSYLYSDSCITLYKQPVLWSDINQITGDTIKMFVNNKQLDSMQVINQAFVISQETPKHYNQVKGKNLNAYFYKGKINFIRVLGNGQSIYYAKENEKYIGVNVIDCSSMDFYFEKGKLSGTKFISEPSANFFPIAELKPEELRLKGFKWQMDKKPIWPLKMNY